jgi:hypothetical protein
MSGLRTTYVPLPARTSAPSGPGTESSKPSTQFDPGWSTKKSPERLDNLERQDFDVTRTLSHVTLVSPSVTSRGLVLGREPLA